MKSIPAILFFIFTALAGYSQRVIKGRVVNEATGAAIPGSSVFITNTSRGTTSDNSGYFELTDIPAGKHDLIISSVGYETNVFSFSDEQLPLQLKIQLAIKVKELDNVLLEQSVEEGWDKWGRMFMENFVGNTANAAQCKILNEKDIRFRYYKKSNRVAAYCDGPVIMENRALGYRISYQLENFEVNFSQGTTFYLGYSLFEQMNNKGRLAKWERNRKEAYNGSIMHFMRSLYDNRLLQEGFEVVRMVRTPNYEKQRIRNIYKAARTFNANQSTGITIIGNADSTGGGLRQDSSRYYESVLRQPDNIDRFGTSFLSADSLILETQGDYKALFFDNFIYVTYTKEMEEEGYLARQFPARKATYQRSYVVLTGDKLISLDRSGNYYNPQDFFTSAYWGWSEKMANSLPLDYEAGE